MAEEHIAHAPKAPIKWDEEMEEMDEYLERTGISVPPVSQLLHQVDVLEGVKLPDDQVLVSESKSVTEGQTSKELETLMGNLDLGPWDDRAVIKMDKGKAKVVVEDDQPGDPGEYQESFASQQETAQLREELESMGEKYKGLEEQVSLMMKERDNLPEALNQIRADLNKELTAFSDKLYTLLEDQAPRQEVKTAISQVEDIRAEHSDQLRTAVGYLKQAPKKESPLVTRGVSLKGKGKFKPIK